MQGLTIQQIALERLDHLVDFPLGSIDILEQLLDAVPMGSAVKLTILTVIEELTMLLAHIFLVLLTMPDLHWPLPSVGLVAPILFPFLVPQHKPAHDGQVCYSQNILMRISPFDKQ
jgi:hypothetical protein